MTFLPDDSDRQYCIPSYLVLVNALTGAVGNRAARALARDLNEGTYLTSDQVRRCLIATGADAQMTLRNQALDAAVAAVIQAEQRVRLPGDITLLMEFAREHLDEAAKSDLLLQVLISLLHDISIAAGQLRAIVIGIGAVYDADPGSPLVLAHFEAFLEALLEYSIPED